MLRPNHDFSRAGEAGHDPVEKCAAAVGRSHSRVIGPIRRIVLVPAWPCFAVDAKQKMATCKFGADDQKLQGAARNAFLKKCMANRDEPRGPARPGAMAAPKQ